MPRNMGAGTSYEKRKLVEPATQALTPPTMLKGPVAKATVPRRPNLRHPTQRGKTPVPYLKQQPWCRAMQCWKVTDGHHWADNTVTLSVAVVDINGSSHPKGICL